MASFSERLADLRSERKLTQTEFARIFGVGRSTIAMWETGDRTPDLETMKKLADFFDVSLDYLVGESDNRNNNDQRNVVFSCKLKVILDDLSDEYRDNLDAYVKAFIKGLNEIEEVMTADHEATEDEKKVKEYMFNILSALTVYKKRISVPVLRLFLKQLEVLQEELNKNVGTKD